MIEITAEIRALIDKAAAGVELAEDEYIDLSDGLIHCKKCGGQRQTVVPCFGKSGYFMPRCICQCQQEAEEQRKPEKISISAAFVGRWRVAIRFCASSKVSSSTSGSWVFGKK